MKSIIHDIEFDYGDLVEEQQVLFITKLEYYFNSFLNLELMECLTGVDLDNRSDAEKLFIFPVKCLLRIYDSIEFWHKQKGRNGYFRMLEEFVYSLSRFYIGR